MSILIAAVLLVAIAAVALIVFGINKATEARIVAKLDAAHRSLLDHLSAHGVTLDDTHSLAQTLVAKAKDVITDVEKSKAVQEIEDALQRGAAAMAAGYALRDSLVGTSNTSPAAAPAPGSTATGGLGQQEPPVGAISAPT